MTALTTAAPWLQCPVCHQPLAAVERTLRCPTGHSYDIARQGYVNLLGRGSPHNADTANMVAARARFLSTNHYAPITDTVAALVPAAHRILEVGAGTGHHLAGVLNLRPSAVGVAADVSVAACRRAARAHPRMASVVADTWTRLPLADGTVDAVLCIFAPRNPAEFSRVLSPGGVVVVVVPQPDHLQELRDVHDLLDVGANKLDRLAESVAGFLEIVSSTPLTYHVELSGPEATDLVAMGPNAFHDAPAIPATRVSVSVTCVALSAVCQT